MERGYHPYLFFLSLMTSFNISQWYSFKNTNPVAFRQVAALDKTFSKHIPASGKLPNILTILKIIDFQDEKQREINREVKENNKLPDGTYKLDPTASYLLPSVGLARLVTDNDLALYPKKEVCLSMEFERALQKLMDSECKGITPAETTFTWLTEHKRIRVSLLICLFFMFDSCHFEDRDDIFIEVKEHYQDAVDAFQNKVHYKEAGLFVNGGFSELGLNELAAKSDPWVDVQTSQWIRFVGLILSQL